MRLRYWLREGVRLAIPSLIIAGVMSFLFNAGYSDLFSSHADFILFFGAIFIPVSIGYNCNQNISVALSLGCTRREAAVAVHFFRFVCSFPFFVAYLIIAVISATEGLDPIADRFIIGIALYFFLSGINGAGASLRSRHPAISVVALLFSFAVFFVVSFLSFISAVFVKGSAMWILLAVSIAVYAFCASLEADQIKKMTVR